MISRRSRQKFTVLLSAAILLTLLITGCTPGPTTIVGSVSFLNPSANPRMFPPDDIALWDFTDDVWYARLVDNNGTGTVLWESEAYSASNLASFIYRNPLYPGEMNTTLDTGYYLGSFVITLTDAQVNTATMPLRLETYLYDSAVVVVDPVADAPNRYSYYNLSGDGDPGWRISMTIRANETKTAYLNNTVDFP